MAPKKYYSVVKGHKIGIFETWDECKKQVDGFKGAIYKSFLTKKEAEEFLGIGNKESKKNNADVVAYVDGSYNIKTKEFSYGMVILINGNEETFYEKSDDRDLASMRNVSGEIMGSMKAMEYAINNGYKEIDIYFDYEGIEKWAMGYWKTNKKGTRDYKKYYDDVKSKLKVNFIKVSAHTGDKYNDMADLLAKKALGL